MEEQMVNLRLIFVSALVALISGGYLLGQPPGLIENGTVRYGSESGSAPSSDQFEEITLIFETGFSDSVEISYRDTILFEGVLETLRGSGVVVDSRGEIFFLRLENPDLMVHKMDSLRIQFPGSDRIYAVYFDWCYPKAFLSKSGEVIEVVFSSDFLGKEYR